MSSMSTEEFVFVEPVFALWVEREDTRRIPVVIDLLRPRETLPCIPLFTDQDRIERCIDQNQITEIPLVCRLKLSATVDMLQEIPDSIATHVTVDPNGNIHRWVWTKEETIARIQRAL